MRFREMNGISYFHLIEVFNWDASVKHEWSFKCSSRVYLCQVFMEIIKAENNKFEENCQNFYVFRKTRKIVSNHLLYAIFMKHPKHQRLHQFTIKILLRFFLLKINIATIYQEVEEARRRSDRPMVIKFLIFTRNGQNMNNESQKKIHWRLKKSLLIA